MIFADRNVRRVRPTDRHLRFCAEIFDASALSGRRRPKRVHIENGLYRGELDDDISVDGLLAGRGDMTRRKPEAA